MQFQVPQFLDVEDKIFGPLSFKQLIYVAGGAGMAYLSWRYIPFLGLLLGIGLLAFGVALAFWRPNNRPFVVMVESGFNFLKSSRRFVWKRTKQEAEIRIDNFNTTIRQQGIVTPTTGSSLSNLAWSIDVHGGNEVSAQKGTADDAGAV